MNNPRNQKTFYSVTEYGVKFVTGLETQHTNMWWCPEVRYTLTEGYSLFSTEKEALLKAIADKLNEELKIIQARKKLEDQLNKLS